VRLERENCCDDLAVAVCGNRLVYARALAALEGLRSTPLRLAAAADGGPLLARVRRLLGVSAPASHRLAGWLAAPAAPATRPRGAAGGLALPSSPAAPAAQADEQPAGRMTVTGRVLDEGGKPVPGAAVAVLARPKSPRRDQWRSSWPQVLGQTRAGADGRFS